MTTPHALIDSPVGKLRLEADASGERLAVLIWAPDDAPLADPPAGVLADAVAQLREYFAGERDAFDLPLAPQGTPFQRSVWDQLRKIPYGTTISYGELARRLGNPNKSRAVGLANGRNPIAIVVPCHRVIGASGKLVGFGGGLPNKRYLLELEGGLALTR